MGFWYSRNVKLLFRCEIGFWSKTLNDYYGYIHNGENFKAIDGTTGTYLYAYSKENDDYTAKLSARALVGDFIKLPDSASLDVCLDTGAWDDTRYTYEGKISGVTTAISQSFPGSTIITVTNSTTAPVTFNALVYTKPRYLSDSATSQGTSKTLLQCAYLCDSPVTLEAGQTYTVEFTV